MLVLGGSVTEPGCVAAERLWYGDDARAYLDGRRRRAACGWRHAYPYDSAGIILDPHSPDAHFHALTFAHAGRPLRGLWEYASGNCPGIWRDG